MEEELPMRRRDRIKQGFSKLLKEDKLKAVAECIENPGEFVSLLKSFWFNDTKRQKTFDEFSENTISNFPIPYGISPNVLINGHNYVVPMVIEESSVVAAASAAAKFWSVRGGFHAEVIDTKKIGQVHFCWNGEPAALREMMPMIKDRLLRDTAGLTKKMEQRGGGVHDIKLVDFHNEIPDYYQLRVSFYTCDSMGANFINSCLEAFADSLRDMFSDNIEIVMSILSNYTPECRVKVWVECPVEQLDGIDEHLDGQAFAVKFKKAVDIAHIDTYRAVTHNKGIYNGIDAVVIATGNDFRAVEAAGHSYAARSGHYESLSTAEIKDGVFSFAVEVPMALGTVGGLTSLHPLAKESLELLGNPTAPELMSIAATMGLANNYSAVKSLITKGIQQGHMKMHLTNILNSLGATDDEKIAATEHFKNIVVSHSAVEEFLKSLKIK